MLTRVVLGNARHSFSLIASGSTSTFNSQRRLVHRSIPFPSSSNGQLPMTADESQRLPLRDITSQPHSQDSSNGQLAFPEAVAKAALTEGAFMYHYHHR